MPKVNQGFNKSAYDSKYHKEHYKHLNIVLTPAESDAIEQAAKSAGKTKSTFAKEILLNALDDM